MSEPVPKIAIRGLTKSFGPKQVLRASTSISPAGQSLVVIGGSGTGKSVLIKCVLGLMIPDSGSIRIDGEEVVGAVARHDGRAAPQVRHAVPGRGPVRQPAGLGERGLRAAGRHGRSIGAQAQAKAVRDPGHGRAWRPRSAG